MHVQLYHVLVLVPVQAVVSICILSSLLHAGQVGIYSLLSFVAGMPRLCNNSKTTPNSRA